MADCHPGDAAGLPSQRPDRHAAFEGEVGAALLGSHDAFEEGGLRNRNRRPARKHLGSQRLTKNFATVEVNPGLLLDMAGSVLQHSTKAHPFERFNAARHEYFHGTIALGSVSDPGRLFHGRRAGPGHRRRRRRRLWGIPWNDRAGERQPGALVPWSTSGAGPQAAPKAWGIHREISGRSRSFAPTR